MAAATALLAIHIAAAGADGATIPPGNLSANPSFELNLNGWAAVGSTMSRVPRSDAPHGGYVALLDKEPGVSNYRIRDEPPTVGSSVEGTSYRAHAWVRRAASEADGKQIALYVRERTPVTGATVGEIYTKIPLSNQFQPLSTTYVAKGNGNRIDTYLRRPPTSAGSLVSGEMFYADAYSLITLGPVSVVPSTTTIRPDEPLPPNSTSDARLTAAKNEFESFQVTLQAGNTARNDVTIQLDGPLSGPGGATIPTGNVTIYREADYDVTFQADGPDPGTFPDRARSDREGEYGKWPDALIPERDYLYGEDRAAFPYDLAANKRLVAWVDVLAPTSATPGTYSGTLEVNDSSGSIADVPVTLKVLDISLPSTSSLKSAFYFNAPASEPCLTHTGNFCSSTSESSWQLHYLYGRAALENRVTIPNPVPFGFDEAPPPNPQTSDQILERNLFEAYTRRLLDGASNAPAGISAPRLAGARLTSVGPTWDCAQTVPCLSDWRSVAAQDGFTSRVFVRVCDEPLYPSDGNGPLDFDDWPDCRANSLDAAGQWPDVPRMVTGAIQNAELAETAGLIDISSEVDLLTPTIHEMADRPSGLYPGNQRPEYMNFLSGASQYDQPGTAPNDLWIYTACMSHGCSDADSANWDGWAGYVIDQPPSEARAMAWLAFEYDVSGELYYDVTARLEDAWSNQYLAGGNGDGTLFYPGLPAGGPNKPAVGGTHSIPIESLRLKRIRDGREDYELLKILGDLGYAVQVKLMLETVLGDANQATYGTDFSQTELEAVRCWLFDAIRGTTGSCLTP